MGSVRVGVSEGKGVRYRIVLSLTVVEFSEGWGQCSGGRSISEPAERAEHLQQGIARPNPQVVHCIVNTV